MSQEITALLDDLEPIVPDVSGGSDDKTDDSTTGTNDDNSDNAADDDAGTGDASKVSDDGKGAGNDDGDSTTTGDVDVDPLVQMKADQDELRQMLRVSRRDNATMKAKLDRLGAKPTVGEEEFDADGNAIEKKVELSRIEELQGTLQNINDTRGASLEILATQMSETKQYADIADVCSRHNMDDVIEAAANALVEQNGGDIDELVLELEASIWSKQNPYKYLYDLVKTYHPKYQKADDGKTGDKGKKSTEKSASSIQDMGGAGDSSSGKGGWTADKIDAMPEDELGKVPADIYDKYLAGELD